MARARRELESRRAGTSPDLVPARPARQARLRLTRGHPRDARASRARCSSMSAAQAEFDGERFWPSGAGEDVGRAGRLPAASTCRSTSSGRRKGTSEPRPRCETRYGNAASRMSSGSSPTALWQPREPSLVCLHVPARPPRRRGLPRIVGRMGPPARHPDRNVMIGDDIPILAAPREKSGGLPGAIMPRAPHTPSGRPADLARRGGRGSSRRSVRMCRWQRRVRLRPAV